MEHDITNDIGMTVLADSPRDAASRFMAEFWNRLPEEGHTLIVRTTDTAEVKPLNPDQIRLYYMVRATAEEQPALGPGEHTFSVEEIAQY